MSEYLDWENQFDGIENWRKHAITGKGVAVWNCENNSGHGKKSRIRILESAPDATVYSGSISCGTKNGMLVNAVVHLENEDISLEKFIKEKNIKVVNASLSPAPFSHPGYKTLQGWKNLIEEYDLCCFASSANDSKKDKMFDNSDFGWWYVGAVYHVAKTGEIRRHGYSNGGAGLDFVDWTGDWAGTSSSSPHLAGKCALIRQRYPEMDRFQVYEYMKEHAKDSGDTGEDNLFGHGLVILPDDFTEDDMQGQHFITKTQILVNDKIIEVKRVMVNDENYIRLRDFDDVLGICKIDYDPKRNLPIIRKE